MINIQELINKTLRDKNDQKEKKDQTTWHISQLGNCLRGQYFSRLGVEPDKKIDDRVLRVFDIGNRTEEWIVDLIKQQKEVKIETQVRVFDKKLNISGYIDLVLEQNGKKIVYEIKSKHSKSFWYMREQGAQLTHKYQIIMYCDLLGVKTGQLVYVSKDDLSIMEFGFQMDSEAVENIRKQVLERIALLNEAWKKKDPSILPLPDKSDWQSKYCDFHEGHCLRVAE